jgi:hypothetical protein
MSYYNAQKLLQAATRTQREAKVFQGEAVATSYLDTPVFSNLVFPSFTYYTLEGLRVDTEEVTFNTVLFNVRKFKNVVKKKIAGSDGAVRIYVNEGDFMITIRGIMDLSAIERDIIRAKKNLSVYPLDVVIALDQILGSTIPIPVESDFLNTGFNIQSIVPSTAEIPQEEGKLTTQIFTINAESDRSDLLPRLKQ